ncbi:hypothetical protein KCP69_01835 [Salmonella enterica subsp. enterica]|nr:hypothetical protein KCP69_01835 [Salmonella enterica subsp. enterica]
MPWCIRVIADDGVLPRFEKWDLPSILLQTVVMTGDSLMFLLATSSAMSAIVDHQYPCGADVLRYFHANKAEFILLVVPKRFCLFIGAFMDIEDRPF